MSRTATRSLAVSALAVVIWAAAIALAFGCPARFGGSGAPDDVAGELVIRGTAASPSLLLTLVLAVSVGQVSASPTPDVPEAVLVASGTVGGFLSLVLLIFGVAELAARARNRPHVPATVSSRLLFPSSSPDLSRK